MQHVTPEVLNKINKDLPGEPSWDSDMRLPSETREEHFMASPMLQLVGNRMSECLSTATVQHVDNS